jgi:hypothetical protein
MDENPYQSLETQGAPVRSKRRGVPLYVLIVAGVLIASTAIALLDALYVESIVQDSATNAPKRFRGAIWIVHDSNVVPC